MTPASSGRGNESDMRVISTQSGHFNVNDPDWDGETQACLSPLLVSKLNLHKSPEGTVLAGNVQPGARAAGAQLWLFNHSNSTFQHS